MSYHFWLGQEADDMALLDALFDAPEITKAQLDAMQRDIDSKLEPGLTFHRLENNQDIQDGPRR